MIKSLTPQQKARIPEFVQKWSQIALSTAPADRPAAERGIRIMYETAGYEAPLIIWCTSPLAAGIARSIILRLSQSAVINCNTRKSVGDIIKDIIINVGKSFHNNMLPRFMASVIRDSIGDCLWNCDITYINTRMRDIFRHESNDNIREIIWERVLHLNTDEDLHSSINTMIKASAGANPKGSIISALEDEHGRFNGNHLSFIKGIIEDAVNAAIANSCLANNWDAFSVSTLNEIFNVIPRDDIISWNRAQLLPMNSVWRTASDGGYGQHDADLLMYYDYLRSVCELIRETMFVRGHLEQAQAAGWYLPHKYTCWVSERHNILRLNNRNLLHCENGPAVSYPDGWCIYALNGVPMRREYIMTPAEEIKPHDILAETNVDVRRELLRKVGVSRVITFGKEVDRQGTYKLIDMSPIFRESGINYAPYLLMTSVSLDGVKHLEGVAPECRTVEQAINWRSSEVAKTWNPDLLS
jgi:hypothetical protein